MSSYSLAVQPDHHQFASNFDKVHAYHQSVLQNNKANFTVSHLLDLEELPSDNCAMFANTDQQHQTLHQHQSLNGNSNSEDIADKNSAGKNMRPCRAPTLYSESVSWLVIPGDIYHVC